MQFAYIEAPTIPVGMTVTEYRRSRSARRRWIRRIAAMRR